VPETAGQIKRRDFLKRGAAGFLGLTVFGIVSCNAPGRLGIGDKLSPVTLSDLMGNRIAIPAALSGKIALIHFWASWCPTCRGEMTSLESIWKKYLGAGVVPYSIGIGERRDTAVRYIENLSITYPILVDPNSLTQKQFGISGIPTYYILDRKGIIRLKIIGDADKSGWDKIIKDLL
jgi:cytochrome c biogenesis protein CcmG, thiol:disulfide interchange protein DsbE